MRHWLLSLVCSDSIQVLNISAGSWGPDNCAAYLREHGLFGAKAFLLVVSSHDAYDNMNFQPTVGVHVSFPDKQYVSAIYELVDRYLVPRVKSKLGKKSLDPDQQVVAGVGIDKKGGLFNPGFAQLKAMADSAHIPMAIYLHPDMEEYKQHRYNSQGEDIIAWAKENQVPLYLGMDVEKLENYRDGIHINADGQKELARTFRKMLADMHLMN